MGNGKRFPADEQLIEPAQILRTIVDDRVEQRGG